MAAPKKAGLHILVERGMMRLELQRWKRCHLLNNTISRSNIERPHGILAEQSENFDWQVPAVAVPGFEPAFVPIRNSVNYAMHPMLSRSEFLLIPEISLFQCLVKSPTIY